MTQQIINFIHILSLVCWIGAIVFFSFFTAPAVFKTLDRPTAGTYHLDGEDVTNLPDRQMVRLRRNKLGFVFQTFHLVPRMTAMRNVELPMVFAGFPSRERRERAEKSLVAVGLDHRLTHRPDELSGGERQRVAIARAIVLKPKFIVLDEPTSALDRSVQAQIIDLLRELQAKHKLAYLFISHDLKVVRAISDQVIVMRDGKVVEQGAAAQIFDQPKEAYTKALMAAAFEMEAAHTAAVSE